MGIEADAAETIHASSSVSRETWLPKYSGSTETEANDTKIVRRNVWWAIYITA
jgi:hypothetical protein